MVKNSPLHTFIYDSQFLDSARDQDKNGFLLLGSLLWNSFPTCGISFSGELLEEQKPEGAYQETYSVDPSAIAGG